MTLAFTAIAISLILAYLFLYFHPVRWRRMVGCFAIFILSIGLGVVEDSIPMYILMSTNFIIAGLQFTEDVGSLLQLQ